MKLKVVTLIVVLAATACAENERTNGGFPIGTQNIESNPEENGNNNKNSNNDENASDDDTKIEPGDSPEIVEFKSKLAAFEAILKAKQACYSTSECEAIAYPTDETCSKQGAYYSNAGSDSVLTTYKQLVAAAKNAYPQLGSSCFSSYNPKRTECVAKTCQASKLQ